MTVNDRAPFAHIGVWNDDYKNRGRVSTLGVWGWTMLKNGADEKNKLLDPILKVWGGAKSEGVWTAGKGESLSEEVIVQPRHSFYYSGLYLGDRFHSPLIRLIGEVIVTAHQLKTETSLSRLEYWEAFRNPGRDYTRPPR